jgi:aldose 1-epimerase
MIPTGDLASVAGTPFDFVNESVIGDRIESLESTPAQGYDHCYALTRFSNGDLDWAAVLSDPGSGRTMMIETNQPGLQFYTGNFLDGSPGSGGFQRNEALCLETQYFPDTPNRPDFPSSLLQPGETYHHRQVCTFLK